MENLISQELIQNALPQVQRGLNQYSWLQNQISTNEQYYKTPDFQRKFNGFYRIRRGLVWRTIFYQLMHEAQKNKWDFAKVLLQLHEKTGRVEASFSSKMIASLDTDQPVIDRFVLDNLGLRLPRYYDPHRIENTISLYKAIQDQYLNFLQTKQAKELIAAFDAYYPNNNISNHKKVDLILWQSR